MKAGFLYSGVLLGLTAICAVAGTPPAPSAAGKRGVKVAARVAVVLKKNVSHAAVAKVSPSAKPVLTRRETPVAKMPAGRKVALAAKPAKAKKGVPATVKALPRTQKCSAVKPVAVCPVKKPPPALATVTKAKPVPVIIRHDPGEFIDISYPPRFRAKVPALAVARLPRR